MTITTQREITLKPVVIAWSEDQHEAALGAALDLAHRTKCQVTATPRFGPICHEMFEPEIDRNDYDITVQSVSDLETALHVLCTDNAVMRIKIDGVPVGER
ncbi:MAG: hypothetical protein IKD88_00880 [Lachnospiraceae bacterium]|nr:hypothetical protein [Lachnospiraceae bacterium]